jgi:dTDP-4-dehydrorhamnose 3,5-epimerase
VYDLTGEGEPASWQEIARTVFDLRNGNGSKVQPVSTKDYYAGAKGPVAPRPAHSTLDLAKIEATGYTPADWHDSLTTYMKQLR